MSNRLRLQHVQYFDLSHRNRSALRAVCGAGSTVLPRIELRRRDGAVMKPQDIVMTRAPIRKSCCPIRNLFAENFSNIADPTHHQRSQDDRFHPTRSPISGQPRAYNCSRTVVENVQTQQPPTLL